MDCAYEQTYREFQPTICPQNFNFAVDILDDHAANYPQSPAIWVSSLQIESYQINYAQLSCRSHRTACMFWEAGVRPGDKVIMVMDKYVLLSCRQSIVSHIDWFYLGDQNGLKSLLL